MMKKRIIRPRKTQAHNRLSWRTNRREGVRDAAAGPEIWRSGLAKRPHS
jgi:hypothetical protein